MIMSSGRPRTCLLTLWVSSDVSQHPHQEKVPQWVCHPAGTRVVHIYVKQQTLYAFLNEQLDDIGYSKVYNDAVMNADDLVRSKFGTASSR